MGEQVITYPPEQLIALHCLQAVEPKDVAYVVPEVQLVHTDTPGTPEYVPAGQEVQVADDWAPVVAKYVPAAQDEQAETPEAEE